MRGIFQDLQDPRWWFTAVLMAMVVSLAAPFIQRGLGQLAGLVSASARNWVKETDRRRAAMAEFLSRDVGLLVGTGCYSVATVLIGFGAVAVALFMLLALAVVDATGGEFVPTRGLWLSFTDSQIIVSSVGIAAVGTILLVRGFRKMQLFISAIHIRHRALAANTGTDGD